MTNLSAAAIRFLKLKPIKVGIIGGQTFYENPTLGDEGSLYMITEYGRLHRTIFFELPELHDLYSTYSKILTFVGD